MSQNEAHDYLEMSFRSISCFGNDGKLDRAEFDQILTIALRDGKLDDNEKRVLGRIISLLQPGEAAELAPRIAQLKALYDI
ncbi:hypothetical protein QWZ03_08285 [Chitinimonas viridis]|uniref:Tellurite resistance protein TerB n=1 Tax=Chitinimonas viridis TaxID=664880 RepID=A0ABT8B3F0_9NEIS|nr:hypothetical protein [Chitinimonas viridis]MDN3576759.1 hypothetical protein [Chitinimonas viridis]